MGTDRRLKIIAVVATVLIGIWVLAANRHSATTQGATDEGPTPGLGASTTTEPGTFELAGSSRESGTTTIPTLDATEPTIATTTTTLPGSDSADGVCQAMSRLYDVSRALDPATAAEDGDDAVQTYTSAIEGVRFAVESSSASTIVQARGALVELTTGVIGLLGPGADEAAIGAGYQRLTDAGNPAVAAMITHLRSTCPSLATTLETGIG